MHVFCIAKHLPTKTWLSWNGKRVQSESRKQGKRCKSAKIAANTASGDGQEAPRKTRIAKSETSGAARQRARAFAWGPRGGSARHRLGALSWGALRKRECRELHHVRACGFSPGFPALSRQSLGRRCKLKKNEHKRRRTKRKKSEEREANVRQTCGRTCFEKLPKKLRKWSPGA